MSLILIAYRTGISLTFLTNDDLVAQCSANSITYLSMETPTLCGVVAVVQLKVGIENYQSPLLTGLKMLLIVNMAPKR